MPLPEKAMSTYQRCSGSIEGRLPLLSFFLIFVLFYFASPYDFLWTTKQILTDVDTSEIVAHGNLARQVSLTLFGSFALISLLKVDYGFQIKINNSIAFLLLFYFLWMGLSVIWAEDWQLTLRKLAGFAQFYLIAFWMARRFSFREITFFAYFTSLLVLILSFGAELVLGTFHPFAGDYRFSGIMHSNTQGWNCAILFIASCVLAKKTVSKYYSYYLMTALSSVIFLFQNNQ